ncbi:MAG: YlxM family DNA-binding protein [Firmicutes bacterium]|nr:YlxM family DNA-binding protein [Bacillota bacterium]
MAADTVQWTMLFDFYGELLTEKQREYYDLHHNEDLSLQEIAEQNGVTRQGVWDIVRRAEDTLLETEEKTGLLTRFLDMQKSIARLTRDAAELRTLCEGRGLELCDNIISDLEKLKG